MGGWLANGEGPVEQAPVEQSFSDSVDIDGNHGKSEALSTAQGFGDRIAEADSSGETVWG